MTKLKHEGNKNSQNKKDKSADPSQADKIIVIINESNVDLLHDQYGEPFARFKVGDHFELWKTRSKKFKQWLCYLYWGKYKKAPNNESVNAALNIIDAQACFQGKQYNLHNRVTFHEGSIYYDLGDWRAVRINSEGWEVISDPPILFRSYSHQKVQVEPIQCNEYEVFEALDSLNSIINIKDKNQKLLFIVNLICAFIPNIPHPIDILYGDQGTAKTTTSTLKKELIDPSVLKNLRFSNNYNEFVQQASHHWHIPLDNLTSLPSWFSDTLCRVVTGEGFSKRELYTNDDDVIYSFKRCISINGINMVPTKPDILDRSVIFEFEPIPQKERIDEASLWKRFDEMKPKYLGAIISILSEAMKIHPTIKLSSKPRMADFAQWGTAVAIAMGHDEEKFMQAYQENIGIQNSEALEANPIARVMINFMENHSEWRGSATDLFNELNRVAEGLMIDRKDKLYPKDPSWLSRRLNEVKANLTAIGIYINTDDTDRTNGRIIYITTEQNRNGNRNQIFTKNAVNAVMPSDGTNDTNDSNDSIFLDLSEDEQQRDIDKYLEEQD